MASYQSTAEYVNLTRLPTPKTEYVVNFEKLTGGLNIFDPDYRLKTNESPDMENMLWKNGTLCSRYGQSFVNDDTTRGVGYTCFEELFWDNAFFHIGHKIYYGVPGVSMTLTALCDLATLYGAGKGEKRGTFLRYGDDLFYKAPDVFVRIHWTGSAFQASDVKANAYVPITYINADWRNGSGTSYQPENRLSSDKTIWFNPGTNQTTTSFSGTGSATQFTLPSDFVYVVDVTVNGAANGNWIVSSGKLTFYTAPPSGTNNIVVTYMQIVKTYNLPVSGATIVKVVVDGATISSSAYSLSGTTVTLTNAPAHSYPLGVNTVRITYRLANNDAVKSIMDCPYAIVYGGNQNICMVVGGCTAQPNAFFWNGNNVAMDVSYWPMEQYNLGGDTEDAITGFGRQQGNLVVFKNRSVGKCAMQFTTTDLSDSGATARVYIEMDYTSINTRIGCDLPWTIQLIDNNLVFANTQQGVHFIQDSSAAYENNIIDISKKVNGDIGRVGLKQRVQEAVSGSKNISSFDDNNRYWLIIDDKVYCWDYKISEYKDPSWFYLTGIDAPNLFMDVEDVYHIDAAGRVTVFDTTFADYGEEMERRYQFATQFFRSYDRLKTVTVEIFTFRPDTDFQIEVTYLNDYEERKDLTDIVCRSWRLVPRNLKWRDLAVVAFAFVARRRPGCRHIRHFSTVLRCTGVGYDMPLLSAQVFYKYEGRDR